MKKYVVMKKLSYLFITLAVLLSDVMCFVVAYNYRSMLCGIEHEGFSAPASIAFIYAIPYALGIIVCAVLAFIFHKKKAKSNSSSLGEGKISE